MHVKIYYLCVKGRYLRFRYMSDSVNNTLNRILNPRSAPVAIQYHSLLVKIPEFSRIATPNLLPSGAYSFTTRESITVAFIRTECLDGHELTYKFVHPPWGMHLIRGKSNVSIC